MSPCTELFWLHLKCWLGESLVGSALWGLQGVQLIVTLWCARLCVGGHAASPYPPSHRRIGKAQAVLSGWQVYNLLAAFTLLNDGVTTSAIELASVVGHEKAIGPFLNRCTNHGYHVLSLWILEKNPFLCLSPPLLSREIFHKNTGQKELSGWIFRDNRVLG